MTPSSPFWDQLLTLGANAGADVWIAVSATVVLSLTTAIFVLGMWGIVRTIQRQVFELACRNAQPEEPTTTPRTQITEAADVIGNQGGALGTACSIPLEQTAQFESVLRRAKEVGTELESRTLAADAIARRLDSIQAALDRQLEYRSQLIDRIDSQLREKCLQMTTNLLEAEVHRCQAAESIESATNEIDAVNRLFEPSNPRTVEKTR